MGTRMKVGVSACLLGERVRYDGGHKLDRLVTDALGPHVEFVPVCPEVEAGFPVPREAMCLVGDTAAPCLETIRGRVDQTGRMQGWARRRVRELEKEDLCGFIFKSKSPSCGMERVGVGREPGVVVKTGVGLFARAFMERFPLVPVEEDGRLHDTAIREDFIERILAFKRWKNAVLEGHTPPS